MPKFSDEEREAIRRNLLKVGRRLFAIHGLKKTSIEDIAGEAGIGKGSFYSFFPSKEYLLTELLEEEELAIQANIREALGGEVSPEILEGVLCEAYQRFYSESVARTLLELKEFPSLMRRMPQDKLEANYTRDMALGEFLRGKLGEDAPTPEVIVGLMRGIFMLCLNRSEIGEGVFDEVLALLIRFSAEGLWDLARGGSAMPEFSEGGIN